MPGATIIANGGARGVSSDVDGRYNLTLGEGEHTISFSFVGYVKVTRKVTSTTLCYFTGVLHLTCFFYLSWVIKFI